MPAVVSALAGDYYYMVGLGIIYLVFSAVIYATYMGKRKKQYPLVLLDGNDDIYFPRTNIPRPLYRDMRTHPEAFQKQKEDEQLKYRPEREAGQHE